MVERSGELLWNVVSLRKPNWIRVLQEAQATMDEHLRKGSEI